MARKTRYYIHRIFLVVQYLFFLYISCNISEIWITFWTVNKVNEDWIGLESYGPWRVLKFQLRRWSVRYNLRIAANEFGYSKTHWTVIIFGVFWLCWACFKLRLFCEIQNILPESVLLPRYLCFPRRQEKTPGQCVWCFLYSGSKVSLITFIYFIIYWNVNTVNIKKCSRNTVTLMLYPLFQILCRSPKTLWGYHFKGPVSRDFRTLLSKKDHLSRQKRFLCGHVSA